MRRPAAFLLVLLAVALTGCTTAGSAKSKKFTGAEGDVAKVVSDLESAGQRKDATKLCTQLFAKSLVETLDSGGTTCKTEMEKATADSDDFSLDVRDVSITGTQATATVRQGTNGKDHTITFAREGNSWKVSQLN